MKKIILLIILITPNILIANPCDQANSLVKRSYFLQPQQEKTLLKYALDLCPSHAIAHNNYANLLENDSHRMKTAGYGNTRPVAVGEFDAAYAKNRRVEIKLGD